MNTFPNSVIKYEPLFTYDNAMDLIGLLKCKSVIVINRDHFLNPFLPDTDKYKEMMAFFDCPSDMQMKFSDRNRLNRSYITDELLEGHDGFIIFVRRNMSDNISTRKLFKFIELAEYLLSNGKHVYLMFNNNTIQSICDVYMNACGIVKSIYNLSDLIDTSEYPAF